MLIERNGKAVIFILIYALIAVLSGNCLFAAGQEDALGTARYRVFPLKHISAEQSEKYLTELGIGTVSQLPGPNALLVTGQAGELMKASAVLGLVDADEPFQIRAIFPASEASKFPSNEQIASEVGNISIGTFSEPPVSSAENKAIIDTCGDAIIAIASSGQLQRIFSAIDRLRRVEAPEVSEVETGAVTEVDIRREEAAIKRAKSELKKLEASSELSYKAGEEDDGSDVILSELIESLARTDEAKESEGGIGKETAEQTGQPSQPNVVVTVAQIHGENEPSVDSSRAQPNLPIVEGLEKNTSDKPKAEPKIGVASEVHPPSPLQREGNFYKPKPVAEGNEMLELNLPEKLNIIDLLDLAGKYLKLDYMYDETKVRGDVALRLQGPIKIKDLYPLLESVLKFRGFVMSRNGNFVTIVPAAEALDIDPILIDPNMADHLQLGDVVITRIFELKYIDTTSAKNLLDGMKLGANITPIEDTGMLIVTGYAYRMGRVEKLLDMIDKPGEPKKFRFRQLKYTTAATLAPKIEDLAEQLGTVSVTIAAPTPQEQPRARSTRARRRVTRRPTAATETEPTSVYLDADERTNRILMIGLEDQLNDVEKLIDSLDVEQQDFRTLRLYEVQHVGAEEVVNKLKELGIIGANRETTAGSRRITRPGQPEEKR